MRLGIAQIVCWVAVLAVIIAIVAYVWIPSESDRNTFGAFAVGTHREGVEKTLLESGRPCSRIDMSRPNDFTQRVAAITGAGANNVVLMSETRVKTGLFWVDFVRTYLVFDDTEKLLRTASEKCRQFL